MKIAEVIAYLEHLAPLSWQENYDNSGLIVGDPTCELTQALICLDSTEEVVDEAIANRCNLIIAHHPIVFKSLKSITGRNYVEKALLKCIKNDITLYAIHTNLDNFRGGVNAEIGERLGLENLQILAPQKNSLFKLSVFVPVEAQQHVSMAMFEAGAGTIGNYSNCSFYAQGMGTFTPLKGAKPYIGAINKLEQTPEYKLEMIVEEHRIMEVIDALKKSHPYEEVAYDLVALHNTNAHQGAGMIGELPHAMDTIEWLLSVKKTFQCGVIRHTKLVKKTLKKIAFCGGSGSFLLPRAMQLDADVYLSADFKYHEFFDAQDSIIIADIGHFESEQYTIQRLNKLLSEKFPTFAPRLTKINTNPINYF